MQRLASASCALLAAAVPRGPAGVPSAPRESYSEERAVVLAHYAGAAYCAAELLEAWTCDHCQAAARSFQASVVSNGISDMQAYVGVNSEGQVIVSFRGSQSLQNWIANLWFSPEAEYPHCEGCKVHSGFYETWNSVADEVLIEVLELIKGKSPQPQVFVTGHSLGGAVAVLAAAALHYEHDIAVEAVYTFGEPRAGNDAFRDFFNSGPRVSWRVTHYKDPVPHLPFEVMGFTHVNTEVYYTEDNLQYRVCDGSGGDSTCAGQWGNEIDLLTAHVDNHHHYVGVSIDACTAGSSDDNETTTMAPSEETTTMAPSSGPSTGPTTTVPDTPAPGTEATTTTTSTPDVATTSSPSDGTSTETSTTSAPGTEPSTSAAPTDDPRCHACSTLCAPCRDCVGGPEGSFPFGGCEKCWQCWDYDDDEKEEEEDDDCNAMHKDHDWDDTEVRCLSEVREDCRSCWSVPVATLIVV